MSALLTYAVGDIHGCHELLARLLWHIRHHTAEQPYRLVFVGDYIDRGPDSASVVRILRQLQQIAPDRVVCLRGNHEDMLLQCIADPSKVPWWKENGGDETLRSFNVLEPAALPRETLQWVASLPTLFEDDLRYYVHAGLAPGRPLAEQTDRDKLWIREPFLRSRWNFSKHVVHGHTPLVHGKPDVQPHRTNIDTGAVFGGALTAAVFKQDQAKAAEFLQAFWTDTDAKPPVNIS